MQQSPEMTKNIAITLLLLLLAPFVVNCFFAYPQTDDFVFSVIARDSGVVKALQYWYSGWTGRFASSALLSITPLVHGSVAGYRAFLALLLVTQLAAIYLLLDSLMRDALCAKEKSLFSLALLFAFLDRMDDVRSGLYWMAGVATYQAAETLAMLLCALLLYRSRAGEGRRLLAAAIVVVSLLLGGMNEIVAVLGLLLGGFLVCYRLAGRRATVEDFGTLAALATGAGVALLAPGNMVRLQAYVARPAFLSVAWEALRDSLGAASIWATSPWTLLLAGMIFLVMAQRPAARVPLARFNPLLVLLLLLAGTFVCFFIPWWSTGMHPQNRVINMIYFFFLLGWLAFCACAFASGAERLMARLRTLPLKRLAVAGAAYMAVLVAMGSSNLLLVSGDLLRGDSRLYAEEMRHKESVLRNSPAASCTVEGVKNTPRSLFFAFLSPRHGDWMNSYFAKYVGKESVDLERSSVSTGR